MHERMLRIEVKAIKAERSVSVGVKHKVVEHYGTIDIECAFDGIVSLGMATLPALAGSKDREGKKEEREGSFHLGFFSFVTIGKFLWFDIVNELRHELDKVACTVSDDRLIGGERRRVVLVTYERDVVFGAGRRRKATFGQWLIDIGNLREWSEPTSARLLGSKNLGYAAGRTTASTGLVVIDGHGDILLGEEQW